MRRPGGGGPAGGGPRAQRGEDRLAALVDRRGDGDDDRVGGRELGRVGGEQEGLVLELAGELDLLVVEQLRVAGGDRVEAFVGDVEADDRMAGDAERDRGGKADIAHADDGDADVRGGGPGLGARQVGGGGNRVHEVASRVCGGGGRACVGTAGRVRALLVGDEECAVRHLG